MKIVVITGSREWKLSGPIGQAIKSADLVITGDARGADAIADECARARGILCIPVHARWDEIGSAAGPERNKRIAALARLFREQGHDVSCHAFPMPSSSGTWDCKRRLESCGFTVEVHR